MFFKLCKTYGLPAPSVVAIFDRNGQEEWFECQSNNLPSCDLFLKFTNSLCGIGAERWVYDDAIQAWRNDFQVLNKTQLISYCRRKAFKEPVIVQRRLVNNKEIAQFSSGALATFRVITCLKPDGKASVLLAALRMPIGGMIVDNYTAGGIIAGVDFETGVLFPASPKFSDKLIMNHHPDTHVEIVGYKLTCWPEIVM